MLGLRLVQTNKSFQLILFDLIGKANLVKNAYRELGVQSFQLILVDLIGKGSRAALVVSKRKSFPTNPI